MSSKTAEQATRQCRKCGHVGPPEDFPPGHARKDGTWKRKTVCRSCWQAHCRNRTAKKRTVKYRHYVAECEARKVIVMAGIAARNALLAGVCDVCGAHACGSFLLEIVDGVPVCLLCKVMRERGGVNEQYEHDPRGVAT